MLESAPRRLRLAMIVGVAASALAACSLTPGANAPETRDQLPISTVIPDGEPTPSCTTGSTSASGSGPGSCAVSRPTVCRTCR
jgi:hypothetical protein